MQSMPLKFMINIQNNNIIVDAAYEGLLKRTFVAMIVLLATHLPFLTGIIFMYRKLGLKPNESPFKDSKEGSDDSESDMDSNNELLD